MKGTEIKMDNDVSRGHKKVTEAPKRATHWCQVMEEVREAYRLSSIFSQCDSAEYFVESFEYYD